MFQTLLVILIIAVILWILVQVLSLIFKGWFIFTALKYIIVFAFVGVVIALCINYRNKH